MLAEIGGCSQCHYSRSQTSPSPETVHHHLPVLDPGPVTPPTGFGLCLQLFLLGRDERSDRSKMADNKTGNRFARCRRKVMRSGMSLMCLSVVDIVRYARSLCSMPVLMTFKLITRVIATANRKTTAAESYQCMWGTISWNSNLHLGHFFKKVLFYKWIKSNQCISWI